MSGSMLALAGTGSGVFLSATMTAAAYTPGGKIPGTYDGYNCTYGSMGSMTSTTLSDGGTLMWLSWDTVSQQVTMRVTGVRATGYINSVTKDGTPLGTVTYYSDNGTYTIFTVGNTGVANPFVATNTYAIVIS